MGSKWKTSFLTDHYIISSGLSKPAKDFGTGYPFLSFKDIFYNYFLPDSLTQLVQSTDKERATCSVRRGDVFLTRTSETMHELGMSSVALKDYADATFNGFCKRLRPKESSELEPEYVGYYLRSPIFRQGMLAFSTMSTRASLNNEMISRLEISYPDRKTQKKIANTLLSLDKKIALSRAINQTLEQMSQTLFKSWFVDFDPVIDNVLDAGNSIPEALQSRAKLRQKVRNSADFKPLPADIRALFPAEFEETELGWVPKGWESVTFDSFCDLIQSGGTPSRKETSFWNEGTIKWLSSGEVKGKIVLDTKEKITDIGLLNSSAKLWAKYTTVVAMYGATAGEVCLIGDKMTANQACCGLYSEKYPFYVYNFVSDKAYELASKATGSAQQNLNKLIISSTKFTRPSNAIISIFEDNVAPLFMNWFSNTAENNTLTALRDTLLPKLISGELSLEDLPDLVTQTEPA
ncbi:restriction endonuclease subunit S [Klebsiella sp. 141198]|uniref:restriction endonuclease subunit S n=1 Tax=Klebsiella sp. 141198 TaxID=3020036 RepID=UPI003D32EAC9